MFEKAVPIPQQHDCAAMLDDMLVGSRDPLPGRAGDALRAFQWTELTTRLNAARDLRRVLRRDARRSIHSLQASFGDAAATYFGSLPNDEQPVNPVALEAPKASQCIVSSSEGDAVKGDARDE